MWGLLKDFPNLKVGGLLRDLDVSKEKGTSVDTLEWTVVLFRRAISLKEDHLFGLFFQPPTTLFVRQSARSRALR